MIETRRLKNVVIFIQTILSFVLSRKIIHINVIFSFLQLLPMLIDYLVQKENAHYHVHIFEYICNTFVIHWNTFTKFQMH